MAKKSLLEREKKRKILYKKFAIKKFRLLTTLRKTLTVQEHSILTKKLQKLPKNSCLSRLRNRCWETGRPRGYLTYFGLCRNAFRNLALNGFLPGTTKSSW